MIKHKKFKTIFTLVLSLHFMALLIPIFKEHKPRVIELSSQIFNIKLVNRDDIKTIVSSEVTNPTEEEPVDSKFLGEVNQKVEKQTIKKSIINQLENKISLSDLSISKNETGLAISKEQVGDNNSTENNPTEFLENVAEGERTSLNTIEFKYYGFYSRLKKQVEGQWHSDLFKLLDSTEQFNRILETAVVIKIDKEGNILGINLEESCGIPSLDQVAIQTFKKIAKIQNPPKELFNNKDFLFLQWIFQLKI
jgi:outer membrane biosynthesis protein TonB